MEITHGELLEMYRWLVLVREVEETFARLLEQGKNLIGTSQLGTGQEAIPVGACFGLRKDDIVMPYIRGRGVFLVKGVPLREIMAGLFGKISGVGRARWAHHHIGYKSAGVLVSSGIIGATIPVSVGAALAVRLKKTDQVVVCFFGDGASNTGNFHEALNMAGVFRLPVVFVCENNQYCMSTPFSRSTAAKNLADRAAGYGFTGEVIDGNDVLAVYEAANEAVEKARSGGGPSLLECKTYRWYGHNQKDPDLLRPAGEREAWMKRCPVKLFKEKLMSKGILSETFVEKIHKDVLDEINEAVRYAEESPYPLPEDALKDVGIVYNLREAAACEK
jgi:TPP-dependent pyruvate/acetoin dehydrogenase alpha subunit